MEGVEEPDRRGGDFGLPLDGGDGGVLVVKNLIVEESVDKGGDPDEAEHRLVAACQLLATLHLRVTPNQFLVVICFLYLHQFITYLYSKSFLLHLVFCGSAL